MNKQDLSPEIQEALDREAKHSATDSNTSFGVLWNEHQRAFKMGALSDTAKRIHQEGMISAEENQERIEYKKKCRRAAVDIETLALPVNPNHDNMTKTMFDLLHMVLVLTNDV